MNEMNYRYLTICNNIKYCGQNIRGTRELNNYQFTLYNPNECLITLTHKKLSKKYLLAELLWYLNERNDVKFIGQFASLWNIISDDGITNNSAYGYILGKKHGFNQIKKIIELLKFDKDSRRAVLNINVPNENVIETKDEMCTIALQFLIRDNKLNCTGIMRSNDIWFGLPYDIVYFTLIQKIIAKELNIEVGTYTHFVVSLHMYDKDKESVEQIINNSEDDSPFKIDFDKLIENKNIIDIVNKDNILDICREKGILYD